MTSPTEPHAPAPPTAHSPPTAGGRLPRARWRSLRAQVLLWTVLPLTIMLIAFSLTGVGSHQASMRALAAEEAERLAVAVATGIAQQLASYQVGIEAAARLVHHHFDDAAMRDFHLNETSAVLGGVDLVLLDADGAPVTSTAGQLPAWAQAAAQFPDGQAIRRIGELVLVRTPVPGGHGSIVAAVPFNSITFTTYVSAGGEALGTELLLLDETGATLLGASSTSDGGTPSPVGSSAAPSEHAGAHPADLSNDVVVARAAVPGTPWTVLLRDAWHTRTAPLIRFEQAMPFVLLVAAAVSFLTLGFGLRLVVQPLRALATRAERIGSGEDDAAGIPVGGVEEIEHVRRAMDEMAAQIRTNQRALEQTLLAVTRAQEDERARLARDLHDETVQGLIALDHRLQKAQRTLQREPSALRDEIAELRRMARHAMDEVRRFSRALRPAYLEDLGICPALEMLCNELGVAFATTGEQRRLEGTIELAIYRIAQESINNARRHAHAHQIALDLHFTPTAVSLRVADDGVGFTPPAHRATLSRDGHFGLLGMQERADLIGAQLSIESSPGRGTRVDVRVAA